MMFFQKIFRFTGILVAVGAVTSSTQASMLRSSQGTKKASSAISLREISKTPNIRRTLSFAGLSFADMEKAKIQELVQTGTDYLLLGDEKKAESFLQAAADQRNSSISVLYNEAVKSLEALALAGDQNVQLRLAKIYQTGFGSIKPNAAKAIQWKLMADKEKIEAAQEKLGEESDVPYEYADEDANLQQ